MIVLLVLLMVYVMPFVGWYMLAHNMYHNPFIIDPQYISWLA